MLGIEQLPDLGDMAEYVGEHSGIGNKLIYAVWGLEEIRGEVYGKIDFLRYVEEKVITTGWSIDACVGYAKKNHLFDEDEMVCTKTLYNYIDTGLLSITNMDLPEKLSRNTKAKKVRKNKKNLGKSIEERPEDVELREEFGHW